MVFKWSYFSVFVNNYTTNGCFPLPLLSRSRHFSSLWKDSYRKTFKTENFRTITNCIGFVNLVVPILSLFDFVTWVNIKFTYDINVTSRFLLIKSIECCQNWRVGCRESEPVPSLYLFDLWSLGLEKTHRNVKTSVPTSVRLWWNPHNTLTRLHI